MTMTRARFASLALAALALRASASTWVTLTPDTLAPQEQTPPATASPEGGIVLPLPFDRLADRAYWDLRGPRIPRDATAITLDIALTDPTALQGLSLHLRKGDAWMTAGVHPEGTDRQTLTFHRSAFIPEGGDPFWNEATGLRLSFWKGAARASTATLYAIRPANPGVAILRGSGRTAPGETGLAGVCATRALALFDRAGISATILEDDMQQATTGPYRLLVLPYNPSVSEEDASRLERFVLRDGGRLALFYQPNPRLATLLGLMLKPYATQDEPWSTVTFDREPAMGLPLHMAHATRHLIPVEAEAADAVTLGHWNTPDGIPDRFLPAGAASPRGIAFAHVPPLARPSAVQWLLASLAVSDPATYAEPRDLHLRQVTERDRQARNTVAATVPAVAGEVRAAWLLPCSSRARSTVAKQLSEGGVNLVFEHLATAGFAHYRTSNAIPESETGTRRSANYVARTQASDKELGIDRHAWVICWSLDGIPSERQEALRQEGRLMLDAQGQPLPWLCPSHPANRAALQAVCLDLADRGVTGIHFDYIRYPANDGCYSPATRAAFEARVGNPVPGWPGDVLPGGPRKAEYDAFRKAEMNAFVHETAALLRARQPGIRLSAAVYPTPERAAENGQDWPAWLKAGDLDFACPMLYAGDVGRFTAMLDLCLAAAPAPARLVPGIGNSADESQLDALGAARQIASARQRGTGGVAFFQVDADLTDRILPIVRLRPLATHP